MAIELNDRAKTAILLAGVAVVAYLAYRWWRGRSGGSPTDSFGTNLNSAAPALVGGSAGPDSGLSYTAPTVNVTTTQPVGGAATGGSGEGGTEEPPPKKSLLPAPSNFSVTPHPGLANFGWHPVTTATGSEVKIAGPTPIDKVVTGTHASYSLKPGNYTAMVRAVDGSWSMTKKFTVKS